jgi:DNA-directed RNA polymerase specialized sigma24 family protein
MSWNNAYEKRKFEEKQKKQAEKYRALGMTEEQIKEMYEFDYAQFKSERRFRMHTQSFEPDKFDDDEDDNEKLSIVEKFQDVLATTQDDSTDKSRYWWIEEIENEMLLESVKKLSPEDLELITKNVIEGYSQTDLAKIYGISQKNISKKIKKIKNFLEKRV